MDERSKLISKLQESFETRAAYIKAKLGTLVPSQIRALRLQSEMPRQSDLAREAKLHQSRISMFETPGAANMTLETLAKLAAAFKVGVVVKFVPFSDLLGWENSYSQDTFHVTPINRDFAFLNPWPDAILARQIGAQSSPVAEGVLPNQTAGFAKLPPASIRLAEGNSLGEKFHNAAAGKL